MGDGVEAGLHPYRDRVDLDLVAPPVELFRQAEGGAAFPFARGRPGEGLVVGPAIPRATLGCSSLGLL